MPDLVRSAAPLLLAVGAACTRARETSGKKRPNSQACLKKIVAKFNPPIFRAHPLLWRTLGAERKLRIITRATARLNVGPKVAQPYLAEVNLALQVRVQRQRGGQQRWQCQASAHHRKRAERNAEDGQAARSAEKRGVKCFMSLTVHVVIGLFCLYAKYLDVQLSRFYDVLIQNKFFLS